MSIAEPALVPAPEVEAAWALEREAWAGCMGPAVDVLTRAARLTRTTAGGQVQLQDFPGFLAKAVASVAANLGDAELVTAGRPGSWEADLVEQLVFGTVGDDPDELIQFRTEPIVVALNVDQLVDDAGLVSFFEAEASIPLTPDDPGVSDARWERLKCRYLDAYLAYAAAFTEAVGEHALTIPGLSQPAGDAGGAVLRVPVLVDALTDPEEWRDVDNPIECDADPLVWALWSHAVQAVRLPRLDQGLGGVIGVGVRSATRVRGHLAVGVREASWWLRALAGTPAAFPRFALLTGLALLVASLAGYTGWALLALGVLVVFGVGITGWRRYGPASFARLVRDPWWRRRVLRWLRGSWSELMAGCGLARGPHGRQESPELRRAWWQAGELHAIPVLLVGQTVEEFATAQERLRVALEAARVRIIATRQATGCELVWSFTDALAAPFDQVLPARDAVATDRVQLGRAEDGSPWLLNVRVSTLVGGSTGAGKGSVMWGLLVGLGPAIHAGTVRVHGIDLKGGMELALGGPLFSSWATTPADAVKLLEDTAVGCQARARMLAGHTRTHSPSSAEPLVLVVIDELASLLAYLPERDLLRRAEQALGVLLSTGRAPGFYVFAFLQDPRKEVVRMRSLFTQTIALRLRDREEVTMLLGDGAVTAGAGCHKIPASMPGVGYVVGEDGRPQRVRAGYVPDQLIRDAASRFPAPTGGLPMLAARRDEGVR